MQESCINALSQLESQFPILGEAMVHSRGVPPGTRLLRKLWKQEFSFDLYRGSVLVLTFVAYALYHAARKPPSLVKSVLHPPDEWAQHIGFDLVATNSTGLRQGWAPFDSKDGTVKLGEIDVAFLACYSLGMYFAGHLGDRTDLRYFLTAGMGASGVFVCMFGLGYWLNIHRFSYYLVMQMLAGIFQSTGWPSVVSVVANWCGKSRRGLVMGVWNAHTSVGNILGSVLAAAVLGYGWGWAFVVPGLLMCGGAILVFSFLVVEPSVVGITAPSSAEVSESQDKTPSPEPDVEAALLQNLPDPAAEASRAIGFWEAWRIPGVASYASSLLFGKLVAYTFLYWLPFYLKNTDVGGHSLTDQDAGYLSTIYDVGGVVGGISAGLISDRLEGRALTSATFLCIAIPALFLFRAYGHISVFFSISLMFLMGLLINGPYALITTAVSADLGTHESLKGNPRALSTVTAIIDGTGSVGAAIGPLLTGFISQWGWNGVFYMLMFSAFVSALLLTPLVSAEVTERCARVRNADVAVQNLTEL